MCNNNQEKDNLQGLGHNQHLAMLKYQLVQPHAKVSHTLNTTSPIKAVLYPDTDSHCKSNAQEKLFTTTNMSDCITETEKST